MTKAAPRKHPKIKPEFKAFLPKLDHSEQQLLEKSVVRDGILNPVTVWNGFIADGHHRIALAKKHSLPYQVRELPPEMTEEDVMAWMLEFQLGQRNCSLFTKVTARPQT